MCIGSGRSAWPELAPGLIPGSIKQKYAQTVVSTRIVLGCVQFLGEEKRFYTVWVIRVDLACPRHVRLGGNLGNAGCPVFAG
jgi:hypothetical protein